MRKLILLAVGLIFYLVSVLPAAHAKNFIYSVPPPNDTSLYFDNSQTTFKPKHAKAHSRHKSHHLTASHFKLHSTLALRPPHKHKVICRHATKRHTGLYVYYALPAPACCGADWKLHKASCCAHSGEWQTSYYATFKAAPGDFIYSATNDDEQRTYDVYNEVVANGEIDDPEYY